MARFTRFSVLTTTFVCFLGAQSWAWTPTHRVTTPKGSVLIRAIGPSSALFAFSPKDSSIGSEVPDSPMWDPTVVAKFSEPTTPVSELKVGESLAFGDTSLRVYLDPVTREPALEVGKSYRIDFSGGGKAGRSFRLRAPEVDHLYGLGEHLPPELLGRTDGDLLGQVRYSGVNAQAEKENPKGVYGNSMVALAGGNVSNALFPVLHLIDEAGPDALLFLDNPAMSRWDFRSAPWRVELRHGEISGAIAWGKESLELRKEYMTWTGRPPVPPRKAFGLWVSEYGYENWTS